MAPPVEIAESEGEDDEGWDLPHGEDAPMTPRLEDMYSPTSAASEPMSMGHLRALTVTSEDADLHPAADLVSTREDMVADLVQDNISIMEVLGQLGANPKSYRRERSRAVKALVSEIYSAPRVTQAANAPWPWSDPRVCRRPDDHQEGWAQLGLHSRGHETRSSCRGGGGPALVPHRQSRLHAVLQLASLECCEA